MTELGRDRHVVEIEARKAFFRQWGKIHTPPKRERTIVTDPQPDHAVGLEQVIQISPPKGVILVGGSMTDDDRWFWPH